MNHEETIYDRQLAPIVMREVMSQPPERFMRVLPSVATDPRQLAADLRRRINPVYANQIGTESYERRLCADAIEGLLAQRDELLNALHATSNALEWHEDRMPKDQASGALDLARAAIAKVTS